MSPSPAAQPPLPGATSLTTRLSVKLGTTLRDERRRRRWTLRDLAERARLSRTSISRIEAGREASLDAYARLADAMDLPFELVVEPSRAEAVRRGTDIVHAAMAEIELDMLAGRGFEARVDEPYQHYQFAGRADVLAWDLEGASLLHIENKTQFPDIQEAAGTFNAKRQYMPGVVAHRLGIRAWDAETHVIVALWSSEVIHSVRQKSATIRALCPDPVEPFLGWLRGDAPATGETRSFCLLDPLAAGRQRRIVDLEHVLGSDTRPRVRDYRDAADRLRKAGRA